MVLPVAQGLTPKPFVSLKLTGKVVSGLQAVLFRIEFQRWLLDY